MEKKQLERIYLFFGKVKERRIPLALILTGAVGNLFDFFLYGHVIDMFHLNFWGYSYPVFNFSDLLITSGIAWLLLCKKKVEKKA